MFAVLLWALVATTANALECSGQERFHIIMTASHQYLDIMSNWIVIYKRVRETMKEPPSLEIIAEDDEAFEVLSTPGYAAFLPPDSTVSRQSDILGADALELSLGRSMDYKSENFKTLMSRRGQYLFAALKQHCAIIFTDSDVMWLRDPIPTFVGDYDVWAQTHMVSRKSTSFDDPRNLLNPGFMAARRNERTLAMMEHWAGLMEGGPTHNMGKFNEAIAAVPGLKVFKLAEEFPEGSVVEWTPQWIKEKNPVVVHNNWVARKRSKIGKFKAAGLWPCEVKTCGDDPSLVARRRIYQMANEASGPHLDGLNKRMLWATLVQHPDLARDAGLASKPLQGSDPPLPTIRRHPRERALDRILHFMGLGVTRLPLRDFLEIFYL